MKKFVLILLLILTLALPKLAFAQNGDAVLPLVFNRDFGYADNKQIQGTFSLKVKSDFELTKVEYFIDDQVVFSSTEPPYRYQFNTAQFDPGEHVIYAIGYKSDGTTIKSRTITRKFITSEEAYGNVKKLILPFIALVAIISLGSVTLSVLIGRHKEFQPGVYGIAGGAVCPRCGLPFSRSALAPNLIIGKLQRCPHCGKWSVVPRASKQALHEAEARLERRETQEINEVAEKDDYRKLLDESRFDD